MLKKRTKTISIRLDDNILEKIEKIKNLIGLSTSETIRTLIKLSLTQWILNNKLII